MKVLKLVVLVVVVGLGLTVIDQALCQSKKDRVRSREREREQERPHQRALERERVRERFGRGEEKRVDPAKAEEEYLRLLKENFPSEFKEMKAELEDLKEDNPDAYGRKIQRGYRHMHRMQKMKGKDPERFENNIKIIRQERGCRKLNKEYREAETAQEKEEIKAELTKVLGELFDRRLAEGEAKVKALEEEISRLRERAAERKKDKGEIVERRLEELTGEADDLRWQ